MGASFWEYAEGSPILQVVPYFVIDLTLIDLGQYLVVVDPLIHVDISSRRLESELCVINHLHDHIVFHWRQLALFHVLYQSNAVSFPEVLSECRAFSLDWSKLQKEIAYHHVFFGL